MKVMNPGEVSLGSWERNLNPLYKNEIKKKYLVSEYFQMHVNKLAFRIK